MEATKRHEDGLSDDDRRKERREFLFAEYKALHEKEAVLNARLDRNRDLALVSCGAIWSWLGTDMGRTQHWPVLFFPLVIGLLFMVRWLGLREDRGSVTEELGKVRKELEPMDQAPAGQGRVHWWWVRLFWLTLTACNALLVCYFMLR